MQLVDIIIDNRVSCALLETNDFENVIFCRPLEESLDNVSLIVTKDAEFIHNYVEEEAGNYLFTSVTLEDGTVYENVEFKIVTVEGNEELPASTINLSSLGESSGIAELPSAHLIEETYSLPIESTEEEDDFDLLYEVPEVVDNSEIIQKIKVLENKLIAEQKKIDKEKLKLNEERIILDADRKLQKTLEDYKTDLLQETYLLNEHQKTLLEKAVATLNESLQEQFDSQQINVGTYLDTLAEANLVEVKKYQDDQIKLIKDEIQDLLAEELKDNSVEVDGLLLERASKLEAIFTEKLITELEEHKRNVKDEVNSITLTIDSLVNEKLIKNNDEVDKLLVSRAGTLQVEFDEKVTKDLNDHKDNLFNEFKIVSNDTTSKLFSEKSDELNLALTTLLDEHKQNLTDTVTSKINEVSRSVDTFKLDLEGKMPQLDETIKDINKRLQTLVIEKKNVQSLADDARAYTDTKVAQASEVAMTYARRILDLGGGGGSNAVQYANGGTMNGDLNVTGQYLSGGVSLFNILSGAGGSAGNPDVNALVISTSANWNTAYASTTALNLSSGNWQSTYGTVSSLSANWNSAYASTTALNLSSSKWNSTYTSWNSTSATLATIAFTDSKYLPLSGGALTGSIGINNNPLYFNIDSANIGNSYGNFGIGSSNDILINPNSNLILTQNVGNVGIGTATPTTKLDVAGNVTIRGSISAQGTATFANTVFSTTSALSAVANSSGPALYIGQSGSGDLASFYDLSPTPVEVLHVGASVGIPGVGIYTSAPNKELTVVGEISATKTIYASGGNSSNWNNTYSYVNSTSATNNPTYNAACYVNVLSEPYILGIAQPYGIIKTRSSTQGNVACVASSLCPTWTCGYVSVLGGQFNSLCANFATIVGGYNNKICCNPSLYSPDYTVIAGGSNNTIINGCFSNINGGKSNTVSGTYSNVAGGCCNNVSGSYSNVAGGCNNSVSGSYSAILQGQNNVVSANAVVILAGISNSSASAYTLIGSGSCNTTASLYGIVGNGRCNKICEVQCGDMTSGGNNSSSSIILNGTCNLISTTASSYYNGDLQQECISSSSANNSTILNGVCNCIIDCNIINYAVGTSSAYSSILNGICNTITYNSPYNIIGGGCNNSIYGCYNTIVNGSNNSLSGSNNFTLGSNISVSANNFTFVNNLSSQGVVAAQGGNSTNWNSAYNISTSYQNTSGSFATNTLLQSTSALLTPLTLTRTLTSQLVLNTAINSLTGNWNSSYASTTALNLSSNKWNSVYTSWNAASATSIVSFNDTRFAKLSAQVYQAGSGINSIQPINGGNTASRNYSNVAGGCGNTASGYYSNVAGGSGNIASGSLSNVAGGLYNTASGCYSNVAGGRTNNASGNYSNVAGGCGNTASGYVSNVAGGSSNNASNYFSNVAGGLYNTASGYVSNVAGGSGNIASGNCSGILGGICNTVTHSNSFAIGSRLTSTADNTTFVNNLSSQGVVAAANLTINKAPQTFVNPVTASGTFLIVNVNGTNQAIQLWNYSS